MVTQSQTYSPSNTRQSWNLAAASLLDGYTQFVLSRQAMRCSPATLVFYRFTAGAFLTWLELQGVREPAEVTVHLVREYLAQLVGLGRSDTTVHDNARAIKTLLRFWNAEGDLPAPVDFALPKLAKKRLPVLAVEELVRLIAACKTPREKALVLCMADSGLRRGEICALNCSDVDITSGRVRVAHGKGDKARTAVIGASARRALLNYRRDLRSPIYAETPLFLSRDGTRLTGTGLLQIVRRLWKSTGIHVTPHALRRTFVVLSLRGGMDSLHLQALLGHASLDMVRHYAQMVDDDLLQAHRAHSPIDNLARLQQESAAAKAFPKPVAQ